MIKKYILPFLAIIFVAFVVVALCKLLERTSYNDTGLQAFEKRIYNDKNIESVSSWWRDGKIYYSFDILDEEDPKPYQFYVEKAKYYRTWAEADNLPVVIQVDDLNETLKSHESSIKYFQKRIDLLKKANGIK